MSVGSKAKRIENALWGLFCGDSLAMPAHWIYDVDKLQEVFDGGISQFVSPPHPHPESFMVGSEYQPDIETATKQGRKFDILGVHAKYYKTNYTEFELKTEGSDPEHGNSVPQEDERIHYHHGLEAGDVTLGSELVRLLLKSVVAEKRYTEDVFLSEFIEYMTNPDERKDPYTEIYLRRYFEHYSEGKDLLDCAARQREVWSIASMGGLLRPMVLSLLVDDTYLGIGIAAGHMELTHRSETNVAVLSQGVPLLHSLVRGEDPMVATKKHCAGLRAPVISGDELFAKYREAGGPSNLPDDEVWDLHTRLEDTAIDFTELGRLSPVEVVNKRLATACYPEHGWPLTLYFSLHHGFQIEPALLANANAGGDNVHRGALLGLLLGASCDDFPEHLKEGLRDRDALASEIENFVAVACNNSKAY
ncbi:ADP-ribosylglycohydrolase family protein [Pelagicoccus sp. SDUM812002]|uniref:ADP-ribosylglycohydrolase family protein n=1 Tax=Pelagicoccus sp. SDUM812002 TaxID=3041266 RepID=UPI00280CD696|nr:ADP-ribosylglycohydrolase family protein [Pelagicoccus sp. SDUM812002]MDQ8186778.1 ADP-ribosylglycohydrolase family protein [Pelagicoccus sp. SDUM812002]